MNGSNFQQVGWLWISQPNNSLKHVCIAFTEIEAHKLQYFQKYFFFCIPFIKNTYFLNFMKIYMAFASFSHRVQAK